MVFHEVARNSRSKGLCCFARSELEGAQETERDSEGMEVLSAVLYSTASSAQPSSLSSDGFHARYASAMQSR